MIRTSKISWHGQHVKGHQDNNVSIALLSREARLNVAMDKLAKSFWRHRVMHSIHMPSPTHRHIAKEGWQIWHNAEKIASPSRTTLYSAIQDPITQDWWVRHTIVPPTAQPLIDYQATADMMASTAMGHQIRLAKLWRRRHSRPMELPK